jgi:hypothetical protein
VRNCFMREEGNSLVLASGVRPDWWRAAPARFGPSLTPFGPVTVEVRATENGAEVRVEGDWSGDWAGAEPRLEVRLPGFRPEEKIPLGTETLFLLTPQK